MGKKNKPPVVLEQLQVTDLAAEGNALAKHEGKVIFFPFGAPGDVVDVKVFRSKKDWAEGKIVQIHSPSPDRVNPVCSHFTHCGGCKWQHLPYETQASYKERQVLDQLQRVGKIFPKQVFPVVQAQPIFGYRNKVEFSFSTGRWRTSAEMDQPHEGPTDACGFHAPGRFDKVLEIDYCHLTDEVTNAILHFTRDFARTHGYAFYDPRAQIGVMRNLLFRQTTTGQRMVVVIFGPQATKEQIEALMQALEAQFPDLTSLLYTQNNKPNDALAGLSFEVWKGSMTIEEEMEGLYFRISPPSFFQTNSYQTLALYRKVRELAQLTGSEKVYDLYTGTGTIGLFLAPHAKEVIGIEYVEEAVADAAKNAERNGISNAKFFAGDMKDVLSSEFVATHGRPDVVITDPPRAGMHANVIERILDMAPDRVVYVSCNPATQARDVALMDAAYEVVAIQPVDMFPHTHHIENIAVLEKRK
jgi:23S rRNA (uracil1939-C5)-methyltransferase